jgi:hypothetical protein
VDYVKANQLDPVVAVTPVKTQQARDQSVAVGGHPWHLNGHPWDLYGQSLEPEMGAFWSLIVRLGGSYISAL